MKVKLLLYFIIFIFSACNSNPTFQKQTSLDDSLFKKLVDNEIQKTIKLDCDFNIDYGINKNVCFYNDKGFVSLIDSHRFDICEELIYNPPPGCIIYKTFISYYDEYYEECIFDWSSTKKNYTFTNCIIHERYVFEEVITERFDDI